MSGLRDEAVSHAGNLNKMMELIYQQQRIAADAGETVLQTLTRQGIAWPSSCRGGVCQTCLMRCLEGKIPVRAQSGLDVELISKGYFLPCVCKPEGRMVVSARLADDFFVPAQLALRQEDGQGITYLFEPMRALDAGITDVVVRDADGRKRCFQLATRPATDFYFGIFLADSDAWSAQWRTALQTGAEISMRAALDEDLLVAEELMPPEGDAHRPKDPPADPALWDALGEGALLRIILDDFYTRVYADTQLMSFFSGVTRQRLVDKQYSFLQQVMTGNKVYFGLRPHTTHHWMVISDALLDHREQILVSCMQAHGLDENWQLRWKNIEAHYRPDIVKSAPIPRRMNGVDLPLEGFEEMRLDVGAICDGCDAIVESGETVRYHLRRGTIYCKRCNHTQYEFD